MVQLVCLGALLVLVSPISSQEVVCKSGERETVTLKGGDEENNSFRLDSRRQRRRGSCIADYDTEKCSKVSINCPVFATRAYFRCRWGDYMDITDAVSTKRFCRSSGPEMLSPEGDFKIRFRQGFRRAYGDVQCEITCVPKEDGGDDDGGDDDGDDGDDDGSGEEGDAGERGYLAGLSYSFSQDELKSPYCAGTLISSKWILTSAACSLSDTSKIGTSKVSVLLGEENLATKKSDTYKVVSVSGIYYPSSFSTSTSRIDDNIALWRLSESISTKVYRPLCLPKKDSLASGSASLVGWRLSTVTGALNEELSEEQISLETTNCPDQMLCGPATSKCKGDYGGPLVQSRTVIGVVSRDRGCNADVALFTQVSKHIDWIESTMNSNGGGSVCFN